MLENNRIIIQQIFFNEGFDMKTSLSVIDLYNSAIIDAL